MGVLHTKKRSPLSGALAECVGSAVEESGEAIGATAADSGRSTDWGVEGWITPPFWRRSTGGDPGQDLDAKQVELLSDECLADLRKMIVIAGDDVALLVEIRGMFPQAVLERVGLSD
jgi:hypothetical protein